MTKGVNLPPNGTVEPGMKLLEAARSLGWVLAMALTACPSQKNDSSQEPVARSDRKPEISAVLAPAAPASGDEDIEQKETGRAATIEPRAGCRHQAHS